MLKSRIALRFALLGLFQFLVVFGAMEATKRIEQRSIPPFGSKQAVYVARDLGRVWFQRGTLHEEVQRVATTLDWGVEVRDEDGTLIASAVPPADHDNAPAWTRARTPIHYADGRTGTLVYDVYPPAKLPGLRYPTLVALVMCIVGISAFLTARTVTKPLADLSDAARALGAGKLDVRARMKRRDEIGEVAHAFDEMADRIARLLLAERELLANVSHELRTPLARIRVALDLANEGEPAVAVESLKDIAEDLCELERLVDDVLAAARLAHQEGSPASSPLPVRKEPIALGSLLDRAVQKFSALHPSRELVAEFPDDLPTVEGDPVLLRRVFDNLLDNANKYTSKDGEPIRLRAKRDAKSVVIEVQDRGIGIAQDDLARIFEPFFRADRSRTRATGGLGLGLALVKRVVDAHGGTIEFDSEVGKGTTAIVRLPLSRDPN
jgi:two-component system, OmpR family, sensor kinase